MTSLGTITTTGKTIVITVEPRYNVDFRDESKSTLNRGFYINKHINVSKLYDYIISHRESGRLPLSTFNKYNTCVQ